VQKDSISQLADGILSVYNFSPGEYTAAHSFNKTNINNPTANRNSAGEQSHTI